MLAEIFFCQFSLESGHQSPIPDVHLKKDVATPPQKYV